jgi:uncharacterized protein (DUF433 family)
MFGIIIALVAALGVGGTVTVADSARPGDALYNVDRAVENVRLAVTKNETKRDELRVRFAQERVKEVDEIIEEKEKKSQGAAEGGLIADSVVTEIEADIFENETVISIEYGEKKEVYTDAAKTREGIVKSILAKYPSLTRGFVEKTLRVETEDRASVAEDKKIRGRIDTLSEEDKAKVSEGLEAALTLLSQVKNGTGADVQSVTSALNAYLESLPDGARIKADEDSLRIKYDGGPEKVDIKLKEDGKSKIQTRTEDGKIKLEIKDGVLEVKTREFNSTTSTKTRGITEAEAKVYDSKTVIEVEINDEKTIFSSTAKTKDEIIAAIVAKFPGLTREQVSAVLNLEIENSDEDKDDTSEKQEDDNSGRQ